VVHWGTPSWASWPAQACQCSVLWAGTIGPDAADPAPVPVEVPVDVVAIPEGGALGAAFLARVREILESPYLLLL